MQELSLQDVYRLIEEGFRADDLDAVKRWLFPALDQNPHHSQLHFYAGSYFFQSGRMLPAIQFYQSSIDLDPNALLYANMGAALRRMNRVEDAKAALAKAIEYDPQHVNALCNLVACNINEGSPEEGERYARMALEIDPENARTRWNLALCLLEQGKFGEGFDLYKVGVGVERKQRDYGVPTWEKHEPGKRLLVYGEQGLGDELMFHTVLWDAAKDYDIVYDHHPRLVEVFASCPVPGVTYIPNRKGDEAETIAQCGPVDYSTGIADLCAVYRRTEDDFRRNEGPFYFAEPKHIEALQSIANGRKIVGLATRGGMMKTMRNYRAVKPETLAPLFERDDLMFVCFEYEDVVPMVMHINETWGEGTMYSWPSITQHFDYIHTAELVASVDCMVTVCQTVAHLSAAMGQETHVLVPSRPAWRYGMESDSWFLYPEARLYRQQGDDWSAAVAQIGEIL